MSPGEMLRNLAPVDRPAPQLDLDSLNLAGCVWVEGDECD